MKSITPTHTGLLAGLLFTFLAQTAPAASIVEVSQPGTSAREMAVTLDRFGHATMLWTLQGSDSIRPLQGRYESNGWKDWVDIESPGSNWNPRLAQSGEVSTAVWLSYADNAYQVYGARSVGGTWNSPQNLGSSPVWPAPTLAMDGEGCAIAAWVVEHGLRSRHFCEGGWGAETSLSTDGSSLEPQLAANASGTVMAVWSQKEGSQSAIAMAYFESGHWTVPMILHQSNSTVARPQVVLDDEGNAVVAWEAAGANGTRVIQARQFYEGVWLRTVDVSSTQATAGKPQLAMDKTGQVMAVWGARSGDDLLTQGAYLSQANWSPANTLGVVGRVDNWGERGLPDPRITSTGEGQFAAIWAAWNLAENTGVVNTASFRTGRWSSAETLTATRGYPLVDLAAQPDGQTIYVWNNSGVIQALSLEPRQHLLSVNRSGEGRIVSDRTGIDCGEVCAASFAEETSVLLTAQPEPGQVFGGWTGNCLNRDETSCLVQMNKAQQVGAIFRSASARTRQLSLTLKGQGGGRIESDPVGLDCSSDPKNSNPCYQQHALFEVGQRIQLTVTPTSGAYFAGWQGACTGKQSVCAFKLRPGKSSVRVGANLRPNPILSVILDPSGAGRVYSTNGAIDCRESCGAVLDHRQLIELKAEPISGARFLGWSGACSGKNPTCRLRMGQSRNVRARFGD